MNGMQTGRSVLAGLLMGGSVLLVACSDDDTPAGASSGTTGITGTAATGLAMAGATIELRCTGGLNRTGITADGSGNWSTSVPTANLPCVVKAADDTHTYYSFTVGSGSSLVVNVTPLTTLALARILLADPNGLFATLADGDLADLDSTVINDVIAALNAALAGYALPSGFNPVTTPLVAATGSQDGNHYDNLLEQFNDALGATTLASLISGAATGAFPVLPTPSYAPGATDLDGFFSTFAGTYTLEVTSSGGEASSGATAAALFPVDSARTVRIAANGDVTIEAVGRTITYAAAAYNRDFTGTASTQNQVRYRTPDAAAWLELYITYDPATGALSVSPQGFVNDEGYADLDGTVYVPQEDPVVASCEAGDDKLVFTGGPVDFCGFTRSASANSIEHYFQFTSAAGDHGVTYVKFNLNSDDSAVESMVIENDDYAFGCGAGAQPACTGVTISAGSTYRQFSLANTTLDAIFGASEPITVNGLLIHPVTPSGGGGGGTLAAQIGAAHAGTYVLSCPVAGGGSAERTVVINADGSSTVDGVVVVGSGTQNATVGATASSVTTNTSNPALGFSLLFNADDTLLAAAVHRVNNVYTCSRVSGTRTAALNPATVIAGYARSAQLTCTQNYNPGTPVTHANPVGNSAFAIDSSGVVTLGELQLSAADYNGATPKWSLADNATYPVQYVETRVLEVSDHTGNSATEVKLTVTLNADDSLKQVAYSNQNHRGICLPPAP